MLEDNLAKLAFFDGLELYRSSNEYRRKADEIRAANERLNDFDELRRAGMGKEGLKEVMRWLNEDKHLKISKKSLIEQINADDISEEIKTFFQNIRQAMK